LFPHSGASLQFIYVGEERNGGVPGGGVVFSGFSVISDVLHTGRDRIMVWILERIETGECIRRMKRGT
jgi:hypothetical protein